MELHRSPGAAAGRGGPGARRLPRLASAGRLRHRQRDQGAGETAPRGVDRQARRLPGDVHRDDPRRARDGSLRASDAAIAAYAILLQCTGVAVWFDPARAVGPRSGRRAARGARPSVPRSGSIAGTVSVSRRRSAVMSAPGTRTSRPRCRSRRRSRSSHPRARPRRARRSSRRPSSSRLAATGSSSGPTTARSTAIWRAPTRSGPPTCSGRSRTPGSTWSTRFAGAMARARLHDLIDWGAVGEPRIVCGFSDITALHLALAAHAGWVTFYGPNFLRFTRRRKELTKRDPGVVPSRLHGRAARPRVRGPRGPVRAHRRRRVRGGTARRRLPDPALLAASAPRSRSRPRAAS